MSTQSKLVIFITGATAGLGRLSAKKSVDLGHTVIISGRSEEKINSAKNFILKDSPQFKANLHSVLIDFDSIKSVEHGVEQFKKLGIPALDVLVNNAGGIATEFEQINGKVEKTVFMNAVTPLYLTELLLPYVRKSQFKRVLFVASSMHDPKTKGLKETPQSLLPESVTLDDIVSSKDTWDLMKYYKLSKLADIWNTYELAEKNPDITVSTFCPGFVPSTDLARFNNFIVQFLLKHIISRFNFTTSLDDSTNNYIHYITSPEIETSKYYIDRKLVTSSPDSLDKAKRVAYWEHVHKVISELK